MDYLTTVRVLDTDYKLKDEEAARIHHTHKVAEIEDMPDSKALLPTGGGAGQVLAKKSGTDYDVEWQDSSSTVPSVIPVDKGGTGATTAADAFKNLSGYTLDIGTENTTDTWVPVMNGTTVQHRFIPTLPFPVSAGGTGATTTDGALTALGAASASDLAKYMHVHDVVMGKAAGSGAGKLGTVTAPAVSGYTFLMWVTYATVGWIGACYFETPQSNTTNVWCVADASSTKGSTHCYALYVKKV